MIELKAFESERIYWAVEQVEREAGDIDNLHLDDNLFYIKSDADAAIADLEKKLDLYKRGFKEDDRINSYLYAELRRHKYKRCLAMALWCSAEIGVLEFFCGPRIKYYKRWHKRWLELAEKFKEAK